MALSINQVLSEGASTVCFEVSTDATGDAIVGSTIIDPTLLTGAGAENNQTITITRIVASVGRATQQGQNDVPARIALSWGEPNDQTEFLHVPDGAIIDPDTGTITGGSYGFTYNIEYTTNDASICLKTCSGHLHLSINKMHSSYLFKYS